MHGSQRRSRRPWPVDNNGTVHELVDSAPLLGDWAALRRRIHDDGYVFVRGVLDPTSFGASAANASAVQRAGWSEAGDAYRGEAEGARARQHPRVVPRPGYRRMMIQDGVNMLPYLSPFDDLMRQVMGPTAFVYPLKLVRVVYPTSFVPQQPGGTVHKDYVAVQDMFTTWVPLVDVPEGMGGLAVRAGTQTSGVPSSQPESGRARVVDRRLPARDARVPLPHQPSPGSQSVGSVSDLGRVPLAAGGGSGAAAGSRSTSRPEIGSGFFGRKPWWRPVPPGLRFARAASMRHASATGRPRRRASWSSRSRSGNLQKGCK